MHWISASYIHRYRKRHGGSGHLWQGRFKAFPIQQDEHLVTVLRYIERNPLRAGLVGRAEDWLWSSARERRAGAAWLELSPVPGPKNWLGGVNAPMTEAEVEALRHSVNRGTPFGSEAWVTRTARRLGLEASLNPRGRPRARPEK
jgi:putative transposase